MVVRFFMIYYNDPKCKNQYLSDFGRHWKTRKEAL